MSYYEYIGNHTRGIWRIEKTSDDGNDTLHDQQAAFNSLRRRTAIDCRNCRGNGWHHNLWFSEETDCVMCNGECELCAYCSGNSKNCECGEDE